MSKNTPFFSNFVESQIEELSQEEMTQCAAGKVDGAFEFTASASSFVTLKAPSDADELAFEDVILRGTCPGMNPTLA
ncbi:microviridin/marinostatin family tricyclic proteinase inhibitor [Vibrio penaeicida]|uniref:Microviridin/marinostatin family tricyclic proteinase inhibitor n=1 Tax=Vibrio penaeicida TaxID=104609 RepID=A0AAV5NMW2_9VIBR|nr:microviridin/marinostatin family tricyclic proteinase inhibitor [Vibrio penaeicida]RTZ23846.1 microviridin/marinostatin family tricyclic proteinase inhibitor [Vibrio penaeicida]GLQ71639.1 hypothetical protein GCM10007932_09990 [Vibrio penaeicida]